MSLEDLLRGCDMRYGRIQLYRDKEAGWMATIAHFPHGRSIHDGQFRDDPVEALRAALVEDDRKARETRRKYAAAPKGPVEPPPVDQDGMCMICEGGGCDVCRPDNSCRYCADTGHFYGDPELGPCGCKDQTDDFADLLG